MISASHSTSTDTAALRDLLARVVASPPLHARWLNTLSMLENCGARKIARFEHPTEVTATILKHAAEEFRHAFSLKRQIPRLASDECPDYEPEWLLAPSQSRRYLDRLDLEVCRYLKDERGLDGWALRQHAYLLVTWAIEMRAAQLYPTYQSLLDTAGPGGISVRTIIAEEDGHLAEMERLLADRLGPEWNRHAAFASAAEHRLFTAWLAALAASTTDWPHISAERGSPGSGESGAQ